MRVHAMSAIYASLLVLLTTIARAEPKLPRPASGPRPRELPGALATSEGCARCHADIAAEWRSSLHRRSFVDPVFQRGYALERGSFCRGCHAPTADPAREPSRAEAEEGVGCTTCHVSAGAVTGAQPSSGRAHPYRRDVRLAGEGACAGCHEFAFPKTSNQRVPVAMQRTVSEWRGSAGASKVCQDCHMPRVGGARGTHRSHAFAARTPAMLRAAVDVRASRVAGHVEITLEAKGAGHAFPTGDMFRRLEVRAEALDERGEVAVRARPVLLSRSFRDVPDRDARGALVLRRVEGLDTRVGAPGSASARRVVSFTLPPRSRVRWEVAYQRVIAPPSAGRGLSMPIDEVLVAAGWLPVEDR